MSEDEKPAGAETDGGGDASSDAPSEQAEAGEATAAPAPAATAPPPAAPTPAPPPAATAPAPPPAPMKLSDLDDDWTEPPAPPPAPPPPPPRRPGGDDGDSDGESWLGLSRRGRLILIGACTGAVVLAVVIVLSVLNARDYYLECGTDTVVAKRGSTFPWGKTPLEGAKWRTIKIPPSSFCEPRTFSTRAELEEAFVAILLVEAKSRITTARAEDIAEAERQLEQALLLTRRLPAKRDDIERLHGDIEYWRAASELNQALSQLEAAAARFESAAKKKPRHKTDASQWARYTKETAQELRRGPPELRNDADFGPDAPPPFAGTDTAPARPSEPTAPGPTFTGPSLDAGVPAGTALPLPADAAPPPADAALPTGGVLL